ncbi:PorP/SprF family type IX secretion system membrane protein [Niabella terrae]
MKKISLLLLVLTLMSGIHAQSRLTIADYPQFKQYVNPALTGFDGTSVQAFYRNQMTEFDKSPRSLLLSGEARLTDLGWGDAAAKVTHHLGLALAYDREGGNHTGGVNVSYAASAKISTALNLRGGIAVSMDKVKMETGGLTIDVDNDPAYEALMRDKVVNKFGLNLGLALTGSNFYAGYAAYDALKTGSGNTAYYDDNYVLQHAVQAGYRYAFTEGFGLIGHAAYRYDAYREGIAEGRLKAVFKNKYWIGGGYRQDQATLLTAGVRIGQLKLGYSRELHSHRINEQRLGANEIIVTYHFTPVLKAVGRSLTIW